MKKPVNRFAATMWIVAVAVVALDIISVYSTFESLRAASQSSTTYYYVVMRLNGLVVTVAPVAMLVGLGALIEIADQIRWSMRPQ